MAAIALSNLLENLESDGISKNHDYLKSQVSVVCAMLCSFFTVNMSFDTTSIFPRNQSQIY